MRRGQPARAIERRGHILVPHALVDVVTREAARHLVDIVRRARERERIAVALTHQRVEARQIRDRGVKARQVLARAVDKRLFAEDDVAVAVVCDLMALVEHAADQAVVVHGSALVVAVDIGVVVEFDAAPRRAAELARLVGVVLARVADDVEAALCAVLRERIEQHIRQCFAFKAVGRCGKAHRAVVKRHRADALARLHALDAARVADVVLFRGRDDLLDDLLSLFAKFNDP